MPHLNSAETQRVRRLADKLGHTGAGARLGVHHTVIMRILAGLDIRRGSAALVSAALADTQRQHAAPASLAESPTANA